MTPDKLSEIRTRLQNAAEWTLVETSLSADGLWLKPEFGTVEQGAKIEDQAPFFRHVQNDMDELIAEVERAWAEIELLKAENEALKNKETYLGHYINAKGEVTIITRESGAQFIG